MALLIRIFARRYGTLSESTIFFNLFLDRRCRLLVLLHYTNGVAPRFHLLERLVQSVEPPQLTATYVHVSTPISGRKQGDITSFFMWKLLPALGSAPGRRPHVAGEPSCQHAITCQVVHDLVVGIDTRPYLRFQLRDHTRLLCGSLAQKIVQRGPLYVYLAVPWPKHL